MTRPAVVLGGHPAEFALATDGGAVECHLCEHFCRIERGATGICRVRHNDGGRLLTSAYGRVVALAREPIEKKHLFHAFPGSLTLSLGTAGCNLRCGYCINWRVAQRGVQLDDRPVTGEALVALAHAAGAISLAFTYTEPTIFFEYARDLALQARHAGLAVVAKSNGFMSTEALERMSEWVDALNIDLKGWREPGHRRAVGGSLAPVLRNLRAARRLGVWLEISTLVVPQLADSAEDLRAMAGFIAGELGRDVPWHLLRFFPAYKLGTERVTAQARLHEAVDIARGAGLHHVYNGELAHGRLLDTRCSGCGEVVLKREGLRLIESHLRGAACDGCGTRLPGVGLVPECIGEGASTRPESQRRVAAEEAAV